MKKYYKIVGEKASNNEYYYVHMPEHPHADSKCKVPLHKIIMENKIGRYLKRTPGEREVVHHINGDGHDNRLENLQLVTYGEHWKIHGTSKKGFKGFQKVNHH